MRKLILGSAMATAIVLGAVCGFMLLATTDVEQVIETVGQRGWNTIASAREGGGSLGAAAGGVLQVYVWKHAANPAATYNTNLSNASADCYAWANNLNAAMTGNVPYSTTFDLVYKIRVNVSECYNTTGSTWMSNWVRCNLTCANLGIGPLAQMSSAVITSTGTWLWMNFYVNGGAGYTITHGQQVNITSFVMQCYM